MGLLNRKEEEALFCCIKNNSAAATTTTTYMKEISAFELYLNLFWHNCARTTTTTTVDTKFVVCSALLYIPLHYIPLYMAAHVQLGATAVAAALYS